MKKIIILTLVMLLLSACTPQAQVQTVEVTREVPATVEVTRVVEVTRIVEITSTPLPITPTPTITPTPQFRRWTTAQVVDAFQKAGLEVGDVRAMTDQDYGLNPSRAADALLFHVYSICDCGGRIFDYEDPNSLQVGKTYFDTLGKNSKAFFSWTFARDNILIQMNGDVPEDKARLYEKALNEMN